MVKESSPVKLYEVDNSEPLLLKSHHIRAFRRLVVGSKFRTSGTSVEAIAERAKSDAEKIRDSSGDHKKDVIGETEDDLQRYAQNLISIAVEFHSSSDDRIVQIAAREKDIFCQACIVGSHCNQTSLARRAELEEYHIADFLSFARAVPGVMRMIMIEKRPIEGASHAETVLTTNIKTLKEIFNHPIMDYRM